MSDLFQEVYRLVRRVPRGRVSSYGDIAAMCRRDISPRTVGWAMSSAPAGLPWHRIVNQQGRLTIGRRSIILMELQRGLLEEEGVTFLNDDQVAIDRHRWRPRRSPAPRRRVMHSKRRHP